MTKQADAQAGEDLPRKSPGVGKGRSEYQALLRSALQRVRGAESGLAELSLEHILILCGL